MRIFKGSCNSYLLKNILVDAANGIDYKGEGICPDAVAITHEHCDHFSGLGAINCGETVSSAFTKEAVNGKKDEYGLCGYLSIDYPERKIDRAVAQGDIIAGDGIALRVLETPGHSRGAICLYEEEAKILFSGDTVFPDYSMPRTDLLGSEPEKLKDSYEKLGALDISCICPGHGKIIEEKEYIKKLKQLLD